MRNKAHAAETCHKPQPGNELQPGATGSQRNSIVPIHYNTFQAEWFLKGASRQREWAILQLTASS